jgi:hypothetical protein
VISDSASKRDINRQNAQRSTGPHNSRRTRFNSLIHGLTSKLETDLDNPRKLSKLRAELTQELEPQGCLELFLLDRIVLMIARCQRASELESRRIQAYLHPARYDNSVFERRIAELTGDPGPVLVDPGFPALMSDDAVKNLVEIYGRYQTATQNQLFHCLEQLESLQASRKFKSP